ncbi:MAG: hypothetical protein COA50_11730 [Flavobacteriaceae bacterium]|nr:MAG: hypothetical protein COA50_11730 [Flavobacteriaceae bacterium]
MKSDKIEYIRFDDLKTGILMGGKPYLLAHGGLSSFQEVRTPLSQIDLLEKLGNQLRYHGNPEASAKDKWESIKEFSNHIRPFFIDLDKISQDTTHLEVFLNPSELALIPFELLLNEKNEPLFIKKNGKQFVLTRNFRREVIRHKGKIPEKPHVLYIHTKPTHKNFLNLPFPDIPHEEHERSLKYALRHWDEKTQLTVLANPTFIDFKAAIFEAAKNDHPYTHIHILAHGSLIFDYSSPSTFEYGIAFHSKESKEEDYKATSAKEIKSFFESLEDKHLPYLVNYMICDGANFTNGFKPDRNPVQATFTAGVPIVIGSQFPLSMKGSNIITKELYKRLFRGDDLRIILGDIRTSLYVKKEAYGHDWISLVSYVELPKNYEFDLLRQKLKRQLLILNSIRDRENPVLKENDDFIGVKTQIEASISTLSQQLSEIENHKSKEEAFLEGAGLLGSAYKRLAEVEFKEANIFENSTIDKQLEYLEEAKNWYKKAVIKNLSHHWSIVQYLSLKTILKGKLNENDMDYWYAARGAAREEIDEAGTQSTWPYGTLIELYLLNHNTSNKQSEKEILEFTNKLVANATKHGKKEHIISTRLQIERYLNWWNGPQFKIEQNTLANKAEFLNKVIFILNEIL